MNIIEDTGLSVGLSSARGWNPFPWFYRSDAVRQYNIEAFGDIKDNQDWSPYPPDDSLLFEQLSEAVKTEIPITLLVTCLSPITLVANA